MIRLDLIFNDFVPFSQNIKIRCAGIFTKFWWGNQLLGTISDRGLTSGMELNEGGLEKLSAEAQNAPYKKLEQILVC